MEFNLQNLWLEKRPESYRLQEESELFSDFHMCSLVECDDDGDDNDKLKCLLKVLDRAHTRTGCWVLDSHA